MTPIFADLEAPTGSHLQAQAQQQQQADTFQQVTQIGPHSLAQC